MGQDKITIVMRGIVHLKLYIFHAKLVLLNSSSSNIVGLNIFRVTSHQHFSPDWSLVYLEWLARCPEAGDRQETADLAALETPEGVASLPAPLHFWAEETERRARWRPLRPGTLAGLAD